MSAHLACSNANNWNALAQQLFASAFIYNISLWSLQWEIDEN